MTTPPASPFAFRPSPLPSDLRNKLERVVIEARDVAEVGAKAALEALAVHHHEPYPHQKAEQRKLRVQLRAHARQLGDTQNPKGELAIDHLVNECAYEHWHRMLFARFLAENNLLIEPGEKMPISLAEAEELAQEEGVDVWVFASRCAQRMLPQIFRPDDPLLQVSFATEHRIKLESLLASLPAEVFTASDALGWCYQFWQSKKKDQVNRSEVKIGADELPAVTQLFTEPYMVEFLLHNTLGAWWAGKRLTAEDAENAESEQALRRKLALPGVNWDYLRFVRGESAGDGKAEKKPSATSVSSAVKSSGRWRPAAGAFDGWPRAAKDIKVLDPCCGSGHFLVAALHHLVPIRMAEEGLSARDAVDAVLRDNLHGLEIDERCCQIAAFALALAAWTYPEAGGYRPLPELNIACTGIGPQSTKAQWLELAEKAAAKGRMPAKRDLFGKEDSLLSSTVANALEALYDLFAQAPTLGSLIDPRRISKDLYRSGYESLTPLLAEVFKAETDDETRERAIAAAGMVKAADFLAGEYTLVITNVPYLTRKGHGQVLFDYGDRYCPDAKLDLANMLLDRCLSSLHREGTVATVSPQAWLSLKRYSGFRQRWLKESKWHVVARLGEGGFDSTAAAGAFVVLLINSLCKATASHVTSCLDLSDWQGPIEKSCRLREGSIVSIGQCEQLKNPDAIVVFEELVRGSLLSEFANAWQGISTSDFPRFGRCFWEIRQVRDGWVFQQSTVLNTAPWDGRSTILFWEDGHGAMTEVCQENAPFRGQSAWEKSGLVVSQMRSLPATIYTDQL